MAFDGGFLFKTVEELKTACDCHIDKIYQPSKDELVFLLRKKGFVRRLYITVKSGSARIHFTENKFENPAVPPNFCMLLRKYLSAARVLNITQTALERVCEIHLSSMNEMGDTVTLRLVCEFIGSSANVILVKEDGKIIDSLRHSDVETASRLILPGAKYEYPEKMGKLNPITETAQTILQRTQKFEGNLSDKLLKTVDGFSPLVCREIEHLSKSLGEEKAYLKVINDLKLVPNPTLVYKENGEPFEYSYTQISQYGTSFKTKSFADLSSLLDEFYSAKDLKSRINAASRDITKLVNNLIARTEKKLSLRLLELEKCKNRENLRIFGELIKANLHSIQNGGEYAVVTNYYDEALSTVKIPLNPALSPSKNADKYFKDYKKSYTAEQALKELTLKDREEIIYLGSVLDSISRASTIKEIAEIREELATSGYIKRTQTAKKIKDVRFEFKEAVSVEGYRIIIGKNNVQNDYITTRLAKKNDLWFHTKNIPGSHVVVMCGGENVSDETVLQAAALAAGNSAAKNSAQVPVDYTIIKNVKKPSGAKPGMVIYTTNQTVYVTPEKEKN